MNLINLYHRAEDYFFRNISEKYLNLDHNASAYMTGVPISDLNIVYIQNHPKNLRDLLTKSEDFFAQNNLNFVVIIPEKFCTFEGQSILQNLEYVQKYMTTSMALKLNADVN